MPKATRTCVCCQFLRLISDKTSMQTDTASSIPPWWGGSQPGEVLATVLQCPGRAATQCSDTRRQRGSQESRRQDHGKLIRPHLESQCCTYRKHTCTLSSFAVVTFSALLFREKPYSSYVKIIWYVTCLRFLAGF